MEEENEVRVVADDGAFDKQTEMFAKAMSEGRFIGPMVGQQPCYIQVVSPDQILVVVTVELAGLDEARFFALSLDPGTARGLRKALDYVERSGQLGEAPAEPTPH